jgi:hypothetical protein
MINGAAKFFIISAGGLTLLMAAGMIFAVAFDLQPNDVRDINLITGWAWYRLLAYSCVLVFWGVISRMLVKSGNIHNKDVDASAIQADINYLTSKRWKIAVLIAFFEIFIIQQFGL